MAEISSIPLSDLLIDTQNPRLEQPNTGQREALRAFAADAKAKLIALAKDIVGFGMNPSELAIVMPFHDDLKRYVVLEGNRRFTAVKALENPEWLVGAMQPSEVEEMRRLSKAYQENPVESLQCVIMTREQAQHWMEVRHAPGRYPGASIAPWASDDSSRFRSRTGKFDFHTQALNLLEETGNLTPAKRRNVPAASLKRLLGTPEVRKKLGIELQDGMLTLVGEQKRVIKALMHVVNELESGKAKTAHIYTRDQRVAYANDLPASIVVPSLGKGSKVVVAGKQIVVSRTVARTSAPPRDKLIPAKCPLNITEQRLMNIARELRVLSLSQHTNAVSVLFRVFIELSADSYIAREKLPLTVNHKLSEKLLAVSSDLISRKQLTTQQVAPVRVASHRHSFLAPSTALMNEYVHNKDISPAPTDLRAYWDGLQPFIAAIWAP
ncbi:MAG TPA: hypothetical protein VFW25_14875 [Silvibacterium sp.]|nr:hypothetical protein [Silvibacterium sp.]